METGVSHNIPFAQTAFLANVHCNGLVRGLCLLLRYLYWILTRTPPGYPVVALCRGVSAALVLQEWPLHVLKQSTDDVDVRWANLKPWIWAWEVAELFSTPVPTLPGPALPLSQVRGGARPPIAGPVLYPRH